MFFVSDQVFMRLNVNFVLFYVRVKDQQCRVQTGN
jgi:hypothetical protein